MIITTSDRQYTDHLLTVAIDTEAGLLCQSRDQQAWNGARSSKGITGKGKVSNVKLRVFSS